MVAVRLCFTRDLGKEKGACQTTGPDKKPTQRVELEAEPQPDPDHALV